MPERRHVLPMLFAISCLGWSACHVVNGLEDYTFDGGTSGGGDGGAGGDAGSGGSPATFTVSVRVENLSTQVSVDLNDAETIVIDASGDYAFATEVAAGASYEVTFVDPSGEACVADTASGTIADANIEVVISCKPLVRPRFPSAPEWLDYVDASGTSACVSTSATRYTDCLHGGEHRAVYVPGVSSCDDVVGGVDSEGAFDWFCDDSGPYVELLSRGLQRDAGLADLIDFTGQAFKPLSVTIQTAEATIDTTAAAWWSNTFSVADGNTTHDVSGTIYLVLADPGTGLRIEGDRVALVVDAGASISPVAGPALTVSNVSSIWFEGSVDGGLAMDNTELAVLRNAAFIGNVSLQTNSATLAHGLEISQGMVCLTAIDNVGLAIEFAAISLCAMRPAHFDGGTGGYLRDSRAANAATAMLIENATGFAIDRVTLTNFANTGLVVQASSNVHVTRLIVANHEADGVRFNCSNCSLRGATAALNKGRGFVLTGTNMWLSNLLAAGNGLGIEVESQSAAGRNWIAASQLNAGMAINLNVLNSTVTLGGTLKLGGSSTTPCVIVNTTGIEPSACTSLPPSDFGLSGGNANNMFVAKVTVDDSENTSDNAGELPYDNGPDWHNFERITRGWGADGAAMFPNIVNQGRCSPSNPDCRIWDWIIKSNNMVALTQNDVPTGDDTATLDQTFLLSALEALGDGVGDDDNLCETGEVCGYMRNVGGYQGHGALVNVPFTPGTITEVTLIETLSNGG